MNDKGLLLTLSLPDAETEDLSELKDKIQKALSKALDMDMEIEIEEDAGGLKGLLGKEAFQEEEEARRTRNVAKNAETGLVRKDDQLNRELAKTVSDEDVPYEVKLRGKSAIEDWKYFEAVKRKG